ncbi:MAG: iron complex transport system substrate-binding protein [Glaciecola sp.]|jgi:iron complex transport system substrate-binding protein
MSMRVVSLCPSITELIFQLGGEDRLVGITSYCIHPAEGVLSIEKVGGTKDPDVQRIIELAPDLVFFNEEENRKEDADCLVKAGIPLHVSFPKTVLSSIDLMRSVGQAIGCESAAHELAAKAEQVLKRVTEQCAGLEPIRYAYLIWRKPWMAAGADTYLTDLLGLAGGVNVMAVSGDRYPSLELNELANAAPDVILLCSEPFPFKDKHIEELRKAPGLSDQIFILADGEALTWHGSRTLQGIPYALEIMGRARSRQN